ncbi:MAG TPA: serine hydrolase domain-containing protein [Fimbriimonas sp.]|nr:serine hydrolase domain-containing protein [Fimbriimonas sp.]
MRTLYVAALAALAACASADQLDDFIKSEMARQNVPGLTLAIVRDGKVVRTGAYGKADLELDVPANEDNVFEIGSTTKQFTAVLVLQQLEEGKLSLEDPISKYIEGSPATWNGITLRHLLTHTSGLKEYVVIPGLGLIEEFDRKTFLEKMKPLTLDFQPGETFAYSNTNFALLGVVLEKVSGKTYTELINERILKPLEMTNTQILDPDAVVKNRAHGYMNQGGKLFRSRLSMLSNLSDGALMSTAKDLAKWDIALHGGKVLKPASFQLLTTPAKLNTNRPRPYGLGTFLSPLGARPFIGHHGASAGYSVGYGHFPSANLAVIVMTNVYAINGQQIVTSIAEIIDPNLKVTPPAEKPDPSKDRTEKVKAALVKLAANDPDEATLEPEMTAPMKTDRGRMGAGPYAILKTLDGMTFLNEEAYGADRLLTYRLSTPTRNFIARIVWTANNKISEIALRADGAPKSPSVR